MLALNFFRGHGLLVVCAPTYRRPSKRRRQPLACPPMKADLLVDARRLQASGHVTAAAMTARVELERQLTTLAMGCDWFGSEWLGVQETARRLRKRHVLRNKVCRAVLAANAIGNNAAHGGNVTPDDVGSMFGAIDALRSAVARQAIAAKGGAA